MDILGIYGYLGINGYFSDIWIYGYFIDKWILDPCGFMDLSTISNSF